MDSQKLQQMIDSLLNNKKLRIKHTFESFLWFILIYFSNQIPDPLAPFQKEMIKLAEGNQTLVISAFRGAGKSTILDELYALWAATGNQQKKFILIVSQTEKQAQLHFANIKSALEMSSLFKTDLGPFKEETVWNSSTIVLMNGTRISCISVEQNVRGLKHLQYRPDLIIADDIESSTSVLSAEQRDKTYNFLKSDLILAGDMKKLRLIVLGNMYHEDGVIKRLEDEIEDQRFNAIYKRYPFIDEHGKCAWESKYPTQESIDYLKGFIGDERTWMREMLLIPVPDEGQIIDQKWLKYYDASNDDYKKGLKYRQTVMAVDLAISQKQNADNTAIVIGEVYGEGKDRKLYIKPYPLNGKLRFPDTCNTLRNQFEALKNQKHNTKIFVEQVGYQPSVIQTLEDENYPIKGSVPVGSKESRLSVVSPYIKNGNVFFPQKGAEELIRQLIGFGTEKHDDLVDALIIAISKTLSQRERSLGLGVTFEDGSYMINGVHYPAPKRYFYFGQYHTEPIEEYYRRVQGYIDDGLIQ